ncbi:Regulatory protein BlaR1 [Planctomycetes bacterium Poly30]|uniref:Regulatory protein BlaR1 n=1 Tax=Saltatorellus ferox TaxID=2528018 RepID=A0A518EVQ2_9BACT|nr:Regulatory protein BlaR1 [Planctomycetes bacterium Poly30]
MWTPQHDDVALRVALLGSIFLALAHLVNLGLRRRSAATRHLCWSAVLLAVVLIPVGASGPWRVECLPAWAGPALDVPAADAPHEEVGPAAAPLPGPREPSPRFASPNQADPNRSFADGPAVERGDLRIAAPDGPTVPTSSAAYVPAPPRRAFPWRAWLLGGWVLGSVLLLARLLMAAGSASRATSRAVPATGELASRFGDLVEKKGVNPRARLLVSGDVGQPRTTGLLRPVIIAPAGSAWAGSKEATTAILHELAHVARRDVLAQMIGHLAVSLYWWNPMAWSAARAQRREAELCCDDAVLLAGTSAEDYAECLLSAARGARGSLGALQLAMASPSGLEQRIEAALDGERRRAILPASWRRAACVAMALLGVSTATLGVVSGTAVPQEPLAVDSATTLVVSPDGTADFTSIQSAVDAAPDGARIEIREGTYAERVLVTKSLTVVGSGSASCRIVAEFGAGSEPTLKVGQPAALQLSGLKVTSLGTAESGGLRRGAALVIEGGNAKIEDCAIVGSPASGVSISGDATVTMTGCLIAGAWAEGLVIRQANEGAGSVLIKDCAIRHNYHNEIMIAGGAPRTRVEGCWISGAGWHGVRYDGSAPEIVGNRFFGNERSGIYASGKTAARVEGNLFLDTGVSCWFENEDTIVGNTFVGNPNGGMYASSEAAVAIIGQSKPRVERNVMASWSNAVTVGRSSGDGPKNAVATEWAIVGNVLWKNGQVLSVMGKPAELEPAAGNVDADPGFVDAAQGDYSLAAGSAARAKGAGAVAVLPPKSPWAMQDEEKPVATGPDSTSARRKRQALEARSMGRQRAAVAASQGWVDGALQIRDPELRKASVASILAALQSGEASQVEAGLAAFLKITEVEFDKAPFEAVMRELAKSQEGNAQVQAFYGLRNARKDSRPEDLDLLMAEIDEALASEEGGVLLGSASHLLLMFSDRQIKGPAADAVMAMFGSDKADTREILRGLWGARVSPEVAEHIIGLAQKGSRHRHDAIYFGLSTFYEKSPAVLQALFEACEDPDHNNSGRALWGLTYGVPEASHADVADFLILLFEARSSASIRRDCLQGLRTYASARHVPKLEELAGNELLSDELRSSIESVLAGLRTVTGDGDK